MNNCFLRFCIQVTLNGFRSSHTKIRKHENKKRNKTLIKHLFLEWKQYHPDHARRKGHRSNTTNFSRPRRFTAVYLSQLFLWFRLIHTFQLLSFDCNIVCHVLLAYLTLLESYISDLVRFNKSSSNQAWVHLDSKILVKLIPVTS